MRRRLVALIVAAGLAGGLAAGCGIPDHTDVQVDRAGPVSGSDAQTSIAQQPKGRLEATTVNDFVRNFLAASAGELDVDGTTSQRLQDYVAPEASRNVSLKGGAVNVVRVEQIAVAKNDLDVQIKVKHLGQLNALGQIVAPSETTSTYNLQVRAESGSNGGWRLTKVPPVVLLDVEALKTYYTERTVYFWNSERTALVPDLRWLPNEVPPSRVPTELLAMIAGNASPWLDGVTSRMSKDGKLLINAPIDNGQLTMNWSPAAIDNDVQDFLAQQVAWTVRGLGVQSMQLKINGQLEKPYDNVQDLIDRTSYPVRPTPHAYAIVDGKIRALGPPAGTPAPVPLAEAVNHDVRWAAANRTDGGMDAAVVTTEGALLVGSATGESPVTALATVPGIRPTTAPVWLPRSRTGLVTTGSGLYAFGPDRKASKVEGLAGVAAIAAAPDGQRLALIAGGRLYVASVSVGQDSGVDVGNPRQLDAQIEDPTAVAWSGETAVSVGGTDARRRLSIVDVSVDGARLNPRIYDAQGQIDTIATYPENKVLDRSTTMLYQANNQAWLALGSSTQLGRSALDGEPATPSPGTEQQSQPTAPFFIY